MGAGQSTTQFAAPPSRALHVLRVTPASPASKTSIEPLFDFVVGFEGDSLASQNNIDATALERIVEGHESRALNLLVWNAKSQETRVVPIVPSRSWSQGPKDPNAKPSLLGLSMRMCQPEIAMDNVWHVLDVLEGSPAESAGLVPFGDYITGWSGGVLSAENDFYDLVEAHVDKPLRVYVYSHDFDALREVVLVPNRHWGGEGLLGCMFGYGLLHRIPPQPAERIAGNTTPPELRDNADEYEEQELFVPADISQEPHQGPSHFEDWRRQQQDQWSAVKSQGSRVIEEPFRPTPVAPIEEEESSDLVHVNAEATRYPAQEHHHGHGHADHTHTPTGGTTSPPIPPRRTSSLNTSSPLRSSRVHTGSPTPGFLVPAPGSRVPSSSYFGSTSSSNGIRSPAVGDAETSDGEATADTDTDDHGSLTSVD